MVEKNSPTIKYNLKDNIKNICLPKKHLKKKKFKVKLYYIFVICLC